jgi:hypothetical protein
MVQWLTKEEARESEVLSYYGQCATRLYIDHKGRVFVSDEYESIAFSEASNATTVLRKIIELASTRLAELEP